MSCPFVVIDPTDLAATIVDATIPILGLMLDHLQPIPDTEHLPFYKAKVCDSGDRRHCSTVTRQ